MNSNLQFTPWRFFAARLVFLTLLAAMSAVVATPFDAKRPFNLPADVAERSLKQFSAQSGLQVLFAPELTDGIRANAVKGTFTPMEAAERLLAGTPLRVTHDEKTGVLSVVRSASHQAGLSKKKAPRIPLTPAPDRLAEQTHPSGLIIPQPR